jgi:hypothetical protein
VDDVSSSTEYLLCLLTLAKLTKRDIQEKNPKMCAIRDLEFLWLKPWFCMF